MLRSVKIVSEHTEYKTLPCNVGDTVYFTDGFEIFADTVIRVIPTTGRMVFDTDKNVSFDERAIGKSVFLTKEEAEKAKKEKDAVTVGVFTTALNSLYD